MRREKRERRRKRCRRSQTLGCCSRLGRPRRRRNSGGLRLLLFGSDCGKGEKLVSGSLCYEKKNKRGMVGEGKEKGREIKTLTVRTLPPTTAALSEGDRNDLGGMRTSIGLRQPWFKGMSSEIRQRRQ